MTEFTSATTAFNGNAYGVYASASASAATSLGTNIITGVYGAGTGKSGSTVYGGYFSGASGTTNYGIYSAAGTNYFNGNVGIGTTTPTAMLHIGSAAAGGNVKIAKGYLCVDDNDTCSGTNTNGGIYSVIAATTGADVAENYPTVDSGLEAGDVVAADTGFPVYVKKATSMSPILGIISTRPGVLLNGYKAKEFANASTVPVALAGRTPVKVTNENGNIKIGDYLTASKQFNGYAMKATEAGQVIGRALEGFNSSQVNDSGKILMFIQISYYQPKVADLVQIGANSDDQAWLQSLVNLNMTNASVLGDIAVKGSVAIEKDLHVGGIIYAATLNVDTINAKKLCLEDVCVTKVELQKLLDMSNQQPTSYSNTQTGSGQPTSGEVAGTSTPMGQDATSTPSSVDNSTSTPPSEASSTPPADPAPADSGTTSPITDATPSP